MASVGKSDIEHQADIVSKMTQVLAARFFKFSKELTDKDDMEYLIELSKSIGYLTIVSNSVNKTVKHADRLKVLENKLKYMMPNMQMFDDAPLGKYK